MSVMLCDFCGEFEDTDYDIGDFIEVKGGLDKYRCTHCMDSLDELDDCGAIALTTNGAA